MSKFLESFQGRIKGFIDRPKDIASLAQKLRTNPKLVVGGIGALMGLVWLLSSSTSLPESAAIDAKVQKPVVASIQEAVDPRAVWSDEINKNLEALSLKLDETLASQNKKLEEQLFEVKQELEFLKTKEIESNSNISANELEQEKQVRLVDMPPPPAKRVAKLLHLHQAYEIDERKSTEEYVTSGSFARAVLLTGVVAETGTESASSPQPILLRLVDHGIFSKGFKTNQLKEAILIGSCHGKISSERADCRLESVSLMSKDGKIIERSVEGWLIGEDGRPGIKGTVVDKASNVARMAILNGILGGMAGYLQNQASSSIYPISPITGQTNALTGANALKAGAASGVGNALTKLADYAIKRAEQMNPVIVIGSGRQVDVVFKKGFQLKDAKPIASSVIGALGGNTANSSSTQNQEAIYQDNHQGNYQDGVNSLQKFQVKEGGY
jgi:conjugal transfer pilus assembly protein TraB